MTDTLVQPRFFNRDVRLENPDITEQQQFMQWQAELPSSQVWLVNPARGQFEAPTDERGIVDLRALVALGLR
jgi:hypothetical protein